MSKGLEALNKINSGAVAVLTPYDGWQDENIRVYYAEEFNIIENELKEKEELQKLLDHERDLNNHLITHEVKAFDIIKNKKVDMCTFINNFVERNDSYETYVLYFEHPIDIDYGIISEELLTEEEFNLLREVSKI